MRKCISLIKIFIVCIFTISVLGATNFTYAANFQKNHEGLMVADTTIDEVMKDADDFIEQGEAQDGMNEEELQTTVNFLYNLLLAFGIIIAVIVGSVLGIKYMLGSVEEKAEYKQTLVGYLISCIVVFGAFGIWKLVINILSSF